MSRITTNTTLQKTSQRLGPHGIFCRVRAEIEVTPLLTALSVQPVYVVPSQVPQATVFRAV